MPIGNHRLSLNSVIFATTANTLPKKRNCTTSSPVITIAFEYSSFQDDITGEAYNGYTVVVGPAIEAPLEFHGGVTRAWVDGFNIFDYVSDLFHSFA